VQHLLKLFGHRITEQLIGRYFIGTSNSRWKGAAVFWFISQNGKVRAGQVKHFDERGHTTKYLHCSGEKKSCTDWVHTMLRSRLQKAGKTLPLWLEQYLQARLKVCCLFGEPLLNLPENAGKIVALVEAPKTAVIASVYLSQFVWLATGSLSYLNERRFEVLRGRKVILFPDLNCLDKWKAKAKALSHLTTIEVSDLLERKATQEERTKGLDLADYLLRFPFTAFRESQITILSDNIDTEAGGFQTGEKFGNIQVITFRMKDDIIYDVLFHPDGELVKPGELKEEVDWLATYYLKTFTPAHLDGAPCLIHTYRQ
jgi:hypothetical protein